MALVSLKASLGQNGGTTPALDTTGVNGLWVAVGCDAGSTISSFSDSKGNTWAFIGSTTVNHYARIYYCKNPTVGTGHTFTVTGTNIYVGVVVFGISGVWGTGDLDQSNSNRVASAATIQPGSITPTTNNQFLLTADTWNITETLRIDNTFQPINQQPNVGGTSHGVALAAKQQTTAAATNPMWSTQSGGAQDQAAVIGSFFFTATLLSTGFVQPWFGHFALGQEFVRPYDGFESKNAESNAYMVCSAAGVFKNLRVKLDNSPGSGAHREIIFRVNQADTALQCQFAGTSDTDRRDITHEVRVAPGDILTFGSEGGGFPAGGACRYTIEFFPDNPAESIYGGSSPNGTGSTTPVNGLFTSNQLWKSVGVEVSNIVTVDGTLTRLDYKLSVAPGVGNSITFTVYVNGVATAAVVTISGTNTTGSWTGSVLMTIGDIVRQQFTFTGSYNNPDVGWGARFTSTLATGRAMVTGQAQGTPSQSVVNYQAPHAGNGPATYSTTETDTDYLGPITPRYLGGMITASALAPGTGKSWTFDTRKNNATPSPTPHVVLADAAIYATDFDEADAILLSDTDTWTWRSTPAGTPTATDVVWGWAIGDAPVVIPPTPPSPVCSEPLPDYQDPCDINSPQFFTVIRSRRSDGTADLLHIAQGPMRDRTWYGGYKEPRMNRTGPHVRRASDFETGNFQSQMSAFSTFDEDYRIRAFLDQHGGTLIGSDLFQYVTSHEARLAGATPYTLFLGLISADKPIDVHLTYSASARDFLGAARGVIRRERLFPPRPLEPDFPGFGLKGTNTPQIQVLVAPILGNPPNRSGSTPPEGAVPTIYGGKKTCGDGVVRHVLIVAGHACKGGVGTVVYDDELVGTPPAPTAYTLGSGSGIYGPSGSGWASVNPSGNKLYTDFPGGWYTVLLVNQGTLGDEVEKGTRRLWCNPGGLETLGDGTGTQITNLHILDKHIFLNFYESVWVRGPWLPSPTIETYPGLSVICQVDTESWDQVADDISRTYLSSGFTGSFVLGVNGQQTGYRPVRAEFDRQSYVRFYQNRYWQYAVRMFDRRRDRFVATGKKAVVDRFHAIDTRPLEASTNEALLVNYVRAGCDLNLRTGLYTRLAEFRDPDSIRRHGEREGQPFLFSLVSDVPTALAIIQEIQRYRSHARRLPLWRETLCALRNDVMDCVPLTHYNGDTSVGWHGRAVLIEAETVNDDASVDMDAADVEDMFATTPTEPIGGGGTVSPPPSTDPGGTTGGGGAGGTGDTGGGIPGGSGDPIIPGGDNDRYVSTTGSDSASGRIDAPWRNVRFGAPMVAPGATLWIRGGNYDESLLDIIASGSSNLAHARIAAYPGEVVWLRPSSAPGVLQFGGSGIQQYITLDGINLDGRACDNFVAKFYGLDSARNAQYITLQHAEVLAPLSTVGSGSSVPQVILSATVSAALGRFLSFRYLTVHGGNAGVNDFGPHGFYMNGADALIEYCDIYSVGGNGVQIYNGNGGSPDRAIVRFNKIHDLTTVQSGGRHRGIAVGLGTGHLLYGNLIYRISGSSSLTSGIELAFCDAVSLYFNTIYNCQYGVRLDSGITNTIMRNMLAYGNASGDLHDEGSIDTTQDHNLFGTNPNFVNAGADDFHLLAGPAVDAGITIPGITTDLDGITRPQGAAPDIGAYEKV